MKLSRQASQNHFGESFQFFLRMLDSLCKYKEKCTFRKDSGEPLYTYMLLLLKSFTENKYKRTRLYIIDMLHNLYQHQILLFLKRKSMLKTIRNQILLSGVAIILSILSYHVTIFITKNLLSVI